MQLCFKYNTFQDIEKEIKKNLDKKVCILLMSWWIDSSTSLILLQKKWFYVIWVHYNFGRTYKTNLDNKCCNLSDLNDAYNIANKFWVKLFNIDYQKKFENTIIKKFLEKKSKWEHFNPCTLCHDKIKYWDIIKLVKKYNTKIASWYYCKIKNWKLYLPKDEKKNQTQSLIMKIKSEDLKYFEFPLWDYLKSEVREIAKNNWIEIHNKKDSMWLCFVWEKNIKDFIKNYCELKWGDIYLVCHAGLDPASRKKVKTQLIASQQNNKETPQRDVSTTNSKKMSLKHQWLWLYQSWENSWFNTIINWKPTPLFVHSKNIKTNSLILCTKEQTKTDTFYSTKFNILNKKMSLRGVPLSGTTWQSKSIKIQYNSNMPAIPCTVELRWKKIIIKLKEKIEWIIPWEIFLLFKWKEIIWGGEIRL